MPTQDSYGGSNSSSVSKFSSWLPEYYQGPPNRIMRYMQYDQMDMDHEVSAALDTLSDFSTSNADDTGVPFEIHYSEEASPTEKAVLEKTLRQWCNINELDRRMFRLFRSVLKYGDQFLIRDPETFKLHWVDPSTVEKVMVNESRGKEVEAYFIRDLDLNLKDLTASNVNRKSHAGYNSADAVFPNTPYTGQQGGGGYGNMASYGGMDFSQSQSFPVDANHVLHLSLSEGMTSSWPFGISVLENIFKVYKQKELLEDAILIYRIHRAPERRIFYIDTGTMPPNKAAQYLERVRYEVQQKRIPSRAGGGENITDSAYNPMSQLEDYYFAVTADGRGSKVETLPGGENLGCLAMDTKVSLLDGRELTIEQIEQEMKDGKTLWTYSCHPITGEIAPGLISWAGKTQDSAEVMKVTLDSGEEIICTPDHEFPILNRGFVEAKDIKEGQSLIPLYRKKEEISKNKKLDYETVFCPDTQKWKYTHRLVCDFFQDDELIFEWVYDEQFSDEDKYVRHHVDHNRYNNSPDNLVLMSWNDHQKYHCDHGFNEEAQRLGTQAARERILDMKENNPEEYKKLIQRQSEARRQWRESVTDEYWKEHCKKISASIRQYIDSQTPEEKQQRAERSRKNGKFGGERYSWLMNNDPDFRSSVGKIISNGIRQSQAENPKVWEERSRKIIEENIKRWKLDGYYDRVFENQKIKYDLILLNIASEIYAQHPVKTRKEFAEILNQSKEFMDHFSYLNEKVHSNAKIVIDSRKLNDLLGGCNTNWERFKLTLKPLNVDEELLSLKEMYDGNKSQEEFIEDLKKTTEIQSIYLLSKKFEECGIDNFAMFKEYSQYQNHRIAKIEYIAEPMAVGTLSIDTNEQYHDYHTFALSAGVFTKNSIDDLRYFNNKMLRGLGVPSGYLPTGPEDGSNAYNDGRVGAAFIQEFRFSRVCQRYQKLIQPELDREFKLFLKHRGTTVDNSMFEIRFTEPQNFSEYRQLELDNAYANLYNSVSGNPHLSRRFAMKKYLGLSDSEVAENERLWREENADSTPVAGVDDSLSGMADMRSVGVSPTFDDSLDDFDFDDVGGDDMGGDVGGDIDTPDLGGDVGGEPPQL